MHDMLKSPVPKLYAQLHIEVVCCLQLDLVALVLFLLITFSLCCTIMNYT